MVRRPRKRVVKRPTPPMIQDDRTRSSVDYVHFYDYLVRARDQLLNWIGDQPVETYTRVFPFGLGSIRATLIHVADIEWGYVQRLIGRDYKRTESPFTPKGYPALQPFATAWRAEWPATRRVLSEMGDPSRPIEYTSRNFTPPQRTHTTAGGIAGQLLFHEVHHRAQVMTMLRLAGAPVQDLDYSRLVWIRVPIPS